MGTHGSFIFRGCNPHSQDLKTFIVYGIGVQGCIHLHFRGIYVTCFFWGGDFLRIRSHEIWIAILNHLHLLLYSYSGYAVETINPILERVLDSQGIWRILRHTILIISWSFKILNMCCHSFFGNFTVYPYLTMLYPLEPFDDPAVLMGISAFWRDDLKNRGYLGSRWLGSPPFIGL